MRGARLTKVVQGVRDALGIGRTPRHPASRSGSPLLFEGLERRLLLSADPIVGVPAHAPEPASAIVHVQPAAPVATAPPAAPAVSVSFDRSAASFSLSSTTGNAAHVMMTAVGSHPATSRVDPPRAAVDASAQVRYDEVYDGIDLVYHHSADGALEYDWLLDPQADPDTIRMSFSGAFGIDIQADGDLALHTTAGDLIEHAPVLYQDIDGHRDVVDGRFVLRGGAPGHFEVGFEVGAYDASRALVIDPTIGYSTYLGGSGNEVISLTATDTQGNTYVLGTTDSLDLGGGAAVSTLGPPNAFWAKYDAQGRQQYVHVISDPGEVGHSVSTGGAGLLIGAGDTPYILFVSNDSDVQTFRTDSQLHLAALDANGIPTSDLVLLKSDTTVNPVYDVSANGMTLGPDGSIYVSALQLRALGAGSAAEEDFIIKVQPDNGIVFKQPIFQAPQAMTVDAQGNIYAAFTTSRNDLPGADEAGRTPNETDADLYLMEFDPTATSLLHAAYFGGSGHDYLGAMTMDPARPGVLYLTGATGSSDFPMADAAVGGKPGFQTGLRPVASDRTGTVAGNDGFVAVVDLAQTKVLAATYLGGGGEDELTGIALDSVGSIYVSGQSDSADFPVIDPLFASYTPGPIISSYRYSYDFVIAKLDATLDTLLFSTYLGGSGHDSAQTIQHGVFGGPKIRVDGSGTIHVGGTTSSTDFPVLNAEQPDFAGGNTYPGSVFPITREASDGILLTLPQRSTLIGVGVRATAGSEITSTVAIFNSGPNSSPSDFEAMIDWGDGTPQTLGQVENNGTSKGNYRVTGTHTYAKTGAYPVLVTVRDRLDETLSPLLNLDISHRAESQIAPAMAQDPTFLNRLVTVSTTEGLSGSATAPGIALAISQNGGGTWAPRIIADGTDKLPPAESSPDVLFDAFGNLYITYLAPGGSTAVLLSSKDGGQTFGEAALATLSSAGVASLSRPRLAWNDARNEIWLAAMDTQSGEVKVAASKVGGLGQFGGFTVRSTVVGADAGALDIAAGPDGAIAIVWEQGRAGSTMQLRALVDQDGLGDQLPSPVFDVLTARLDGTEAIPTLPSVALGLRPVLAWDTSNGPHRGRLYVGYQDLATKGAAVIAGNLDAYITWSDDGAAWAEPVRVADSSDGQQFMPTLAVDQSTGALAALWYDARTDADVFFTVATSADGGATFSRPQPVADEASNPADADVSDLGKLEGPGGAARIVFANRQLRALWSDNSPLGLENRSENNYEIATQTLGVIDVSPAPVRIRPNPIAAVKGADFNGTVATFTVADDSRELSDFTARIEWGDGAKSNGALSQPGGAGTPFIVTGSHAYAEVGDYPVWVTITDAKDGLPTTAVSNVTALQGSQTETTIAIDPRDPNRVFAAANDSSGRSASGISISKSVDGGVTWTSGFLGDGTDGFPPAIGDPKAAYDTFGNLFLTYLGATAPNAVVVLMSTNGGDDFTLLATFQDSDGADQPSLAVGPGRDGVAGSIWLTWERGESPFQVIMAAGADVTGLGAVGGFQQHYVAPVVVDGQFRNFGDIVIGPKGEVMLSYSHGIAGAPGSGPSDIIVQLDPDGLGPLAFGPEKVVTETRIGIRSPIPAQSRNGVDAEGSLVWDHSGGVHDGRVYLVYTDAKNALGSNGLFDDTDILIRYSDDQGANWTEPIEITDFGTSNAFFPSVALDQSSGDLGVSWYASAGPGDALTRRTATISDDGGVTWNRSEYAVAPGLSDASASTLDVRGFDIQYGDYAGIAFVGGILQPIWTDNSIELAGNPDPRRFDSANARIGIATVNGPSLVVAAVDIKGTAGTPVDAVIAKFTDPNPRPVNLYKAKIDWGDGTDPSAGTVTLEADNSYSVKGTHEYQKEGTYTAKVTITAPRATGTTEAKVEIAKGVQALAFAENGRVRVVREVDFTEVLAILTDGNHNSKAAGFDVTIDWGDGSFSDGVVKLTKAGGAGEPNEFSVSGTHNYLSEQTYAVQITARVKADGKNLDASGAIVNGDPPMTLDITNDIEAALAGVTVGDRILAVFTVDGDIQTDVGEYIATINWGDGTVDANVHPFVNRNDGITVVGRHTYADAGVYFASVTVVDDSGNVATAPLVNTVEPDVTAQIKAVGSGLVYDPSKNQFIGDLNITNISATDIDGPLYVVVRGLPAGVTLDSFTARNGADEPLLKLDQSRLSAGTSLAPIELAFSNPGRVPITYTVLVYDGIKPEVVAGAALVFEPNRGQANDAASFIARGQGYAIGLANTGASLLLGPSATRAGASALMQLVGSNSAAQGRALDPQAGVSNYLGNGPAISQVPHFARVRYESVYAGVDLEYYGHDGVLEYDWVVQPGADAGAIRVRYSGVDAIVTDNAGNLRLRIGDAELVQRAPVAYQVIGGVRHEVGAGFKVGADGTVGLELGAYDASATLVIDPVLVYSTYLGGSASDPVAAVAVDAAGSTYLTGTTYSSDFFTVHPLDPELNDAGTPPFYYRPDAYVTKLDAGGKVVYSTYLGGDANRATTGYGSAGLAIAVDADGRVWTAGLTDSPTFPSTAAPPNGGLPTNQVSVLGAYLSELSADGSHLEYSTVFGAGNTIRDLALDGHGGLYATGNPAFGAMFVLKLDTTSHAVDYLRSIGSGLAFGLAVDSSGQAYVTGSTRDPAFPTLNALFPTFPAPRAADSRDQQSSGFLTKLGSDGAVLFSTYYGGSGGDYPSDIAIDPLGAIVVVGQTLSVDLPVPGAVQATKGGETDGFLLKFANDGSRLLYGTYVGGSGRDGINGVAVDSAGRVYFGGTTESDDLQTQHALVPTSYLGRDGFDSSDGYAGSLQADGSAYAYLTYLGGSGYDSIAGVAVDANGNASYVGSTNSTDLSTRQAAQPHLQLADTFITRILAQDDGTIALRNIPVRALAGTTFDGLVAAFTTNGTETAAQFSASIDWGDGVLSAGTISGDFGSGFRVSGSHLYATDGARDLQVTLLDSNGRVVRSTGSAPGAVGGIVRYHVGIDTAALAGTAGSLVLEFNPGGLPGAPDAQIRISNLSLVGGALAAPAREGNVTGDPSSSATLLATTALNRLIAAATFGSRIDFDVEISGTALSHPGGGNFGSVLALQLLGADGRTPLLAADATGSLLRIDIGSNGTTQVRAAGAAVDTALLGRATVSKPAIQLKLTLQPFSIQEGEPRIGSIGSFTSSDLSQTAGQFTALIDWGDGSTPSLGSVTGSTGHFTLAGSHTYAVTGNYRLAVTLDDGAGSAVFERSPLTGSGFLEASPAALTTGNLFQAPLIADLNGDGLLDVVAPDWLIGSKAVVHLNLGNFAFGNAIDLPTSITPNTLLAAGDFNGDGKTDIVIAGQDTIGVRSVGVLLGDGTGHFTAGPAATQIVPGIASITTADLDADGRLDVIIGTGFSNGANLPGQVLVLRGLGDGGFQAPVTYTVGGGNMTAVAADVNHDGHLDLVVGGTFVPSLQVMLGDGSGGLTAGAHLPVSALTSFSVVDVNADGIPDIVAADGDLAIFTGVGDGTFSAMRQTLDRPFGPVSIAADLDGDGRAELITAEAAAAGPSTRLDILRAGSDGRFVLADFVTVPNGSTFIGAADFNADGKLDIALGVLSEVRVYAGRGDGTLIAPQTLLAPDLARTVIAVDVDNDGRLDLVSGSRGGVSVQLNQGGSFDDPAQVSINGVVANAVQLGDIDGDGRTDIVTGTPTGITVSLGLGNGSFGRPTAIAVGRVTDVALGDVNGDGALDVAVAIPGNGLASGVSGLSILLNDGHGNLTFSETLGARVGLANGSGPSQVVLRDLNGDGKADVIARTLGDYNGSTFVNGGIAIALGGGNLFGALTVVPAGVDFDVAHNGIAVGDVDGDGKVDIVTIASGFVATPGALPSDSGLFVLRGHGDGSFDTTSVPLPVGVASPASPDSLVLADLNRDGRLDIAVTRHLSVLAADRPDDTLVLLGTGGGSFGPAVAYDGAVNSRQLGVGDIDGDGALDLVINENSTGLDGAGMNVLFGAGDGTFGRRVTYYGGEVSGAFAIGDVDGDGRLDVLASGVIQGDLSLLRGRADGSLTAPVLTLTGSTILSLTQVDFNGDAFPDLAYATGDNKVGLLIGRGDGGFDLRTAVVIPDVGGFAGGNSVPREVTLADINADGVPELVATLSTSGAVVSVPLDAAGNAGTPVYRNAGISFQSHSVFGDFDSDGLLDVLNVGHVSLNDPSDRALLLRGRADGTFAAGTSVAVGSNTQAIVAGDLNNDGHLDLVIASEGERDGQLHYSGSVTVMFGLGDGTFRSPVTVIQGQPFDNVALTDLNGDGYLDIAAIKGSSSRSEHALLVLTNNKDGTFAAPQAFDTNLATTTPPLALLGADLSGDGAPELIYSTGDDRLLHVIQNHSAQAGISVSNAPLSVVAATLNPVAGVAFTAVVGTLHDDNPLADAASHSVTIDWGDGSISAATLAADGLGGFRLSGGHVYTTAGVRTLVISAIDGHGASATGTGQARVGATATAITADGLPIVAVMQTPFEGAVAHFSDAGPGATAGDFRARIDWGDGTDTAGQIVAAADGGFEVRGVHTYASAGTLPVLVRITSIGGASATASTQATIGRPAGHAPVAKDDRVVTTEDTPVSFDVRRNDRDADGEILQVEVVSGPSQGTLEQLADGSFSYRPASNQSTGTSFVYRVRDAAGLTSEATVTIDVTPLDDAPLLAPIANAQMATGQALSIQAQASDPDADDTLSFSLDSAPAGATIDANGRIHWLTGDAPSTQRFVVRVADRAGQAAARSFKVTVAAASAPAPAPAPPPAPAPAPAPTPAPAPAPSPSPAPVPAPGSGSGIFFSPPPYAAFVPSVDFSATPRAGLPAPTLGMSGVTMFQWNVDSTAHPYSQALAFATPEGGGASVSDPWGMSSGEEANPGDRPGTLRVKAVVVTGAGLHVRFNQPFDLGALSGDGAASRLTLLRGDLSVKGRVVIDPDGQGFAFIADGTAMREGEYSVRLRSGADGFSKPDGEALDGDADGRAGGDYRGHFKIVIPVADALGAAIAVAGDLDWIAGRWTTEGDAPGVAGDFGIVALGGGLGSLAMLTAPIAVPRTTRAGARNDWRIRL